MIRWIVAVAMPGGTVPTTILWKPCSPDGTAIAFVQMSSTIPLP